MKIDNLKLNKLKFNKEEVEVLKNNYTISNDDIHAIEKRALILSIKEEKWMDFGKGIIELSQAGK